MTPEERRRRLIETASGIISTYGVDRVQMTEVAAAAGVTRPVVYKFFENRRALILAVLEDFETALVERFRQTGERTIPGDALDIARGFVGAVCETLDAKGRGPWNLLDARGPDPEIARLGQAILHRMVAPWLPMVAMFTEAPPEEVPMIARTLIAGARAVLDSWLDGNIDRARAIDRGAHAIVALLEQFRRIHAVPLRDSDPR